MEKVKALVEDKGRGRVGGGVKDVSYKLTSAGVQFMRRVDNSERFALKLPAIVLDAIAISTSLKL